MQQLAIKISTLARQYEFRKGVSLTSPVACESGGRRAAKSGAVGRELLLEVSRAGWADFTSSFLLPVFPFLCLEPSCHRQAVVEV